jgi:transcriptional regulator with XRE-family HTH domain
VNNTTLRRMDDQRVGAAFRAVRIRRGWRQQDVAERARLSGSLISLVERGHLDLLPVSALRRIAGVLDIRVELKATMRSGDIDRILNAGHAYLHEELARHLDSLPGWIHAPEVSFAIYGERGVIDILAFHEPTGSLLVIELKTELVSLEDLLTTMDVRMRHAAAIARDRGWHAKTVSGWIVLADTRPNRRRAGQHSATLRSAFAADGRRMRGWLRSPVGAVRALSFWPNSSRSGVNQTAALRRRVRPPKGALAGSKGPVKAA